MPILEDILKWSADQIRELFASQGLGLQDWDKIHTDWLTFHKAPIRVVPDDNIQFSSLQSSAPAVRRRGKPCALMLD